MNHDGDTGRRELLRAALRSLAVALLGGGALALGLRQSEGSCPPRTVCEDCRLRASCGRRTRSSPEDRPQADAAQEVQSDAR